MAEYLVNGDELTAIANAIRAKAGTSNNINFEDFADKISEIPTNGDSGGGLTIDIQGTFTLYPGESNGVQLSDSEVDGRQFAVRLDPTNCTGVLEYYKATLDVFGRFRIEFGRINNDYYTYPEYTNLADIWFILPRCSNEGANGFSVSLDDDYGEFLSQELLVEWGYLVTSEISLTLQTKTVTKNGTYIPDSGYDGFSEVTVNVESSGMNVTAISSGTLMYQEHVTIDNSTIPDGALIVLKLTNCSDGMAIYNIPVTLSNGSDNGVVLTIGGGSLWDNANKWIGGIRAQSTYDPVLSWYNASTEWSGASIDYELGYVSQ